MKQELSKLMASLGITPERLEEMRKESDRNPNITAIVERGERFKNGTDTQEDRAWLEESMKKSDPNLLTSYHISR